MSHRAKPVAQSLASVPWNSYSVLQQMTTSLQAQPLAHSILVVDDEAIPRRAMERLLSSVGYSVTCAENGEEAWRLFPTARFHLVITDLRMPVMNGPDLLRLLRQHVPRMPVLLVSGDSPARVQGLLTDAIPDAILFKPYPNSELLRMVSHLLSRVQATGDDKGL